MWLLKLLPIDFSLYIVMLMTILGIVGVILGFIASYLPIISKYGTVLKIVSIPILAYSLYLQGGLETEKEWKMKVEELQKKVKVAESKSQEVKVVIQEKIVEKVKYVKGKTKTIIKEVPVYITVEVDKQFPVPESFVVLHDAAARSTEIPTSAGDSIKRASDIKISQVATTVAENYGTCNEIREHLKGWQEWYKKSKEIYESVK